MKNDIAIKVDQLSKAYCIFKEPSDRFRQYFSKNKKYYSEHHALKKVSFTVNKGDILGIIGKNGCGKSTLLQILVGTRFQSSGSFKINGKVAALLELGSGFNPDFTGAENVYIYAAILGLKTKEIDAKYSKILDFADIGNFINQPLKTYSSGMVVRLAFAVIVHVDADILIIDEALSVGDMFFSAKCLQFLKNFALNGTVLFVSHDTNAVLNLCNRAILINNGEIFQSGLPADVIDTYHSQNLQKTSKDIKKINNVIHRKEKSNNIGSFEMYINNNKISGFKSNSEITEHIDAKIISAFFSNEKKIITTLHVDQQYEFNALIQINYLFQNPIVGFSVKDKNGYTIFELNTLKKAVIINKTKNYYIHTKINFRLPPLRSGEFIIDIAVANGSASNYRNLIWLYRCMSLNVVNNNKGNGVLTISPSHTTIDIKNL